LLEAFFDPPTKAALKAAGLASGQRVMELGPGRGSMLGFVSEAIGPDGTLVGIDQNPRFLDGIDIANTTVMAGDFAEATFADAPFDLIYTRFVLQHLRDAPAALRRIHDLLRPGGTLVALEIDFGSHVACDPGHPSAALFDRIRGAIDAGLREADITELLFGRRLPTLFAGAGLAVTSADYRSHVLSGGSEEAAFWKWNAEITIEAAIAAGTLGEDARDILPVHDDPTFRFLSPMLSVAVGHRPDGA